MQLKYHLPVLCLALIIWSGGFFTVSCKKEKTDNAGQAGIEIPLPDVGGEGSPKFASLILSAEEGPDIILASYRDPSQSEWVVSFFRDIIGSSELALSFLINADAYDISPALAFALCWEESRYNPRAFNQNRNDTVDRGLFQLNSASFPNLTIDDFYNPDINVKYGLAHLRWCMNNAGSEVAALAMYNAGHNRVRTAGTPKSTLDYISRILKRQRRIEELFLVEQTHIIRSRSSEAEKKEKQPFKLGHISPFKR